MSVTKATLAMMTRHIEAARRQSPRGSDGMLRRHVRILSEDLERLIAEVDWRRENPHG